MNTNQVYTQAHIDMAIECAVAIARSSNQTESQIHREVMYWLHRERISKMLDEALVQVFPDIPGDPVEYYQFGDVRFGTADDAVDYILDEILRVERYDIVE